MNRRHFLTFAASALPAALILPELIVPRRTFFLPPAGGWAQSSLADLWLSYAQRIVPIGVAIQTALTDAKTPGVWEGSLPNMIPDHDPGRVVLEVGRDMDAMTEWRMRRALAKAPPSWPYVTIASLMPWNES